MNPFEHPWQPVEAWRYWSVLISWAVAMIGWTFAIRANYRLHKCVRELTERIKEIQLGNTVGRVARTGRLGGGSVFGPFL